MTDKEFERAMKHCIKKCLEYKELLGKIETEYERRFGYNPSDIDDNYWIDTFYTCAGGMDFDEIIANAEFAVELTEKE